MTRQPMTAAVLALAAGCVLAACTTTDDEPVCTKQAGQICTFMGTGKAGLGTDGVPPLDVRLYLPQDLSFGPGEMPFVMDWNNHRVRTLDASGNVKTVVGTGELGDAPDGAATATRLNHPTHVTFDPSGMMIMSAWHNSKVMKVDLANNTIKVVCGVGKRAFGGDGGPAHEAIVDLPVATVFDSKGRMIISDEANQRIRRVDENGIIDTIVGPDKSWLAPSLVWKCDTAGQDYDTCKACKIEEKDDPKCEDVPIPQRPRPQGFEGDGGPGTKARLYMPYSQSAPPSGRIAMGPDDTIYIADTGNSRVRALGTDGIIRTVAGSGPNTYDATFKGGYAGDGGPATKALLAKPVDVEVAADGTLFIADTQNSCVRRVKPDGIIDTVAGQCGKKGYGGDTGPATDAQLNRPYGLTLSPAGDLYIADTHNHRIRVVYGVIPAKP